MNLTNAYAKLVAPPLPNRGMINPWLKNLAQNMAQTSGFFDEKELPWIAEIKERLDVREPQAAETTARFRKADVQLAMAVEDVINKSSETLKYDVQMAKNMAMDNEHRTLRGREVVWMVIDYFKTHKSLQTFYSYQDLINF
eukprot:1283943-Alexandrium_andersonii.AAC.1